MMNFAANFGARTRTRHALYFAMMIARISPLSRAWHLSRATRLDYRVIFSRAMDAT